MVTNKTAFKLRTALWDESRGKLHNEWVWFFYYGNRPEIKERWDGYEDAPTILRAPDSAKASVRAALVKELDLFDEGGMY